MMMRPLLLSFISYHSSFIIPNLANFLHESAVNYGGLANGVCEDYGGP
jgi:hypothetical protein